MKILVVGASGYIGSRLSFDLARAGHAVIGVSRRPLKALDRRIPFLRDLMADPIDAEIFREALKEKPEMVIYAVSLSPQDSSKDPLRTFDVQHRTLFLLLNEIYSAKVRPEKFVYLSNKIVYGSTGPHFVDESFVPAPTSWLGEVNVLCESMVEYFSQSCGFAGVNLRLSNVCGAPFMAESHAWSYAVNQFCRDAYRNQVIEILSDGSPQRDFFPVSELSRFLNYLTTLSNDRIQDRTFQFGSGVTRTVGEVADEIAEHFKERFGKEIRVKSALGVMVRPPEIKERFQYSVRRIESLGFHVVSELTPTYDELFNALNGVGQ